MTDVLQLYDYADQHGIGVYWFDLAFAESLSYMDQDCQCYIAINPWALHTMSEEVTKMAHEIGHCITGSFYNQYAKLDLRKKHENRADKWAIRHMIPKSELDAATASGCSTTWELADHFGVTEDLIKKALCLYTHGNLAVELYV